MPEKKHWSSLEIRQIVNLNTGIVPDFHYRCFPNKYSICPGRYRQEPVAQLCPNTKSRQMYEYSCKKNSSKVKNTGQNLSLFRVRGSGFNTRKFSENCLDSLQHLYPPSAASVFLSARLKVINVVRVYQNNSSSQKTLFIPRWRLKAAAST